MSDPLDVDRVVELDDCNQSEVIPRPEEMSEYEAQDILKTEMRNQCNILHQNMISLFDRSGILLALTSVVFIQVLENSGGVLWTTAVFSIVMSIASGMTAIISNMDIRFGPKVEIILENYYIKNYHFMNISISSGLMRSYVMLHERMRTIVHIILIQFMALTAGLSLLLIMKVQS